MEDQILAVYKPKGISSFKVIAILRRLTGVRKIGHAGTLDPLATGVLVVGVGRQATKRLSEEVAKEKEYRAVIRFGMTSTTDDEEGEKTIVAVDLEPTLESLQSAIETFIGHIEQVPSTFSAIKVAGQRAYDLARDGKTVELKARPAHVKEIEILSYEWPLLTIRVVTGPGVYIRALARDLGTKLGVGGYIAELERTRVGEYDLIEAKKQNVILNFPPVGGS